jgi:hypothetical protein
MDKFCHNCGSTTTYMIKGKYPQWFKHNKDWYCSRCHTKNYRKNNLDSTRAYGRNYWKKNPDKLKAHNDKWNPITHAKSGPRRIRYKHKRIYLKNNPRTGKCQNCDKKIGEGIKLTAMHHIRYHDDDALKDTIELCVSCHNNTHKAISSILDVV